MYRAMDLPFGLARAEAAPVLVGRSPCDGVRAGWPKHRKSRRVHGCSLVHCEEGVCAPKECSSMAGKRTRTAHQINSLNDLVERTESLSVDEANNRYEGEWILLLVTDQDERRNTTRGCVLAHSTSEAQITRAIRRIRAK